MNLNIHLMISVHFSKNIFIWLEMIGFVSNIEDG